MFYREREDSVIDYMTIWADDLYMSVPFLCRYYKLTGESKYIEDAVNQVLCFKEKLYMPEKGCMSHVYNLIYDKKTCVPWGRGNGWPIVALTELLEVLPQNHENYNEVLDFYMDFCEGILKLQDAYGRQYEISLSDIQFEVDYYSQLEELKNAQNPFMWIKGLWAAANYTVFPEKSKNNMV